MIGLYCLYASSSGQDVLVRDKRSGTGVRSDSNILEDEGTDEEGVFDRQTD